MDRGQLSQEVFGSRHFIDVGLAIVRSSEAVTQSEIVAMLGLPVASVQVPVRRLVASGLIQKFTAGRDRPLRPLDSYLWPLLAELERRSESVRISNSLRMNTDSSQQVLF